MTDDDAQLPRDGLLRNEFATVRVRLLHGRREGLVIEDVKTGQQVVLDPLELECLAFSRHADLSSLLDPSRTRWRVDAAITGDVDLL